MLMCSQSFYPSPYPTKKMEYFDIIILEYVTYFREDYDNKLLSKRKC